MGTHPIFESDFDCLTEGLKMEAAEFHSLHLWNLSQVAAEQIHNPLMKFISSKLVEQATRHFSYHKSKNRFCLHCSERKTGDVSSSYKIQKSGKRSGRSKRQQKLRQRTLISKCSCGFVSKEGIISAPAKISKVFKPKEHQKLPAKAHPNK